MKTRIDAGTDVAMIGAWDDCRSVPPLKPLPLPKLWGKDGCGQALESDAEAGHLFLIYTGADGGGPIDVFVDEAIPASLLEQTKPQGREYLLRVPTGELIVGGIEDYRSAKPQITGPDSVARIPPGNYLLKCHVGTSEETPGSPSDAELEQALGPEDYQYYRRIDKRVTLGCMTILLFPALIFPLGWKLALVIAIVSVFASLYLNERILARNTRYQRIKTLENEVFRQFEEKSSPTFIFELRTVTDVAELKGGSLELEWKA